MKGFPVRVGAWIHGARHVAPRVNGIEPWRDALYAAGEARNARRDVFHAVGKRASTHRVMCSSPRVNGIDPSRDVFHAAGERHRPIA
ncbi:MAG: hypothetical protein M3O46_03255 [Myxococcota bacterium]|nr:hypothetical protein [Myxococcota bacterium]